MIIGPKPSWGDAVRVRDNGRLGSVTAVRRVETAEEAERHGVVVGTALFVVEFADGASVAVPEPWIEPAYTKTTDEWLDHNVRLFQDLLVAAWPTVQSAEPLQDDGDFLADWVQANWEIIVERPLLQADDVTLAAYGRERGERRGSHVIVCVSKSGEQMFDLLGRIRIAAPQVILRELVTMVGAQYYPTVPFDCALVDDGGIERVVGADDVRFELRPVAE
jgi:hypothetical protein